MIHDCRRSKLDGRRTCHPLKSEKPCQKGWEVKKTGTDLFNRHANVDHHLPMELHNYVELIDWTDRAIAPYKKGSTPENIPKNTVPVRYRESQLVDYYDNLQHRVSASYRAFGSHSNSV